MQSLQSRYNELLKRYMDAKPQDRVRGYDPVAAELDAVECELLDNPPPGCRRGLVLPGEMEKPRDVPILASLTLEEMGIPVLTDSEILDIINDRDRTPPDHYVTGIHNQGQVGSCAGEAASGAAQCRRTQDGRRTPTLNGYFPYHWSSGGSDRGSTLHDNLAILQEYGCASEAVMPRSYGWRANPTEAAMADALNYQIAKDGVAKIQNKREFQTVVIGGYPVQFGYTGHSIFASDIVDLNRLTYTNSWDASWGNNGRGTLSFDRVYWGYGVYAIIAMRGKD